MFTGIGKVNAAIALTKAIATRRPVLIVNLGSAGSQRHGKGEVVCCTRFVQRDMDVTPLGFDRYQTPLSDIPVVLEHGAQIPGWPRKPAAVATASRSTMAMHLMTWSTWKPTCWR